MIRSRATSLSDEAAPSSASNPQPEYSSAGNTPHNNTNNNSGESTEIFRNIASFLTLSDAASLYSFPVLPDDYEDEHENDENEDNHAIVAALSREAAAVAEGAADHFDEDVSVDSWAIGEGYYNDPQQYHHHHLHQQYQYQHLDPIPDSHGSSSNEQLLLWDLKTPATPGLIALSPGATPAAQPEQGYEDYLPHVRYTTQYRSHDDKAFLFSLDRHPYQRNNADEQEEGSEYLEMILQEKRRQWAQQKLAAAVFAHPGSLRSYCLDAYQTAVGIRHQQEQKLLLQKQQQQQQSATPELDVEPIQRKMAASTTKSTTMRRRRRLIIHAILDFVLHNLPVSILIDVLEAVGETSFDTTFACYRLTVKSLNAIARGLVHIVTTIWECIVNFNPFQLLETVVSFQFNAMEKTSEALATGIQSVATGMGSASSMALHRLSTANLSANKTASSGSLLHDSGLLRQRSVGTTLNKKLLKKLSSINDAARVVSYMESEDITGGLRYVLTLQHFVWYLRVVFSAASAHSQLYFFSLLTLCSKSARSKVQRMMHYDVSLRPFVATVQIPMSGPQIGFGTQAQEGRRENSPVQLHADSSSSSFSSDSVASPSTSPFMCTPQSFPPTPHSRSMVMARGSRFADDVVYLARDRLRLHAGKESENEKTRDMAKLLREGKRLAVFDANNHSSGLELSWYVNMRVLSAVCYF